MWDEFRLGSVPAETAGYAAYLLDHSILHGSFGIGERQFAKAMKYKFHTSHQLYLMRDQIRTELGMTSSESNRHMDRDVINSSILLEHARLSQKVRNMPWNNYLSDEDFRQYVLPYRAHREPLDSNWRPHFQRELLPIIDTFAQKDDPVAVCSLVNTLLSKKYELRRIKERLNGELSFLQINQLEGGMCEELVNVTTYAMRSVGIPVVRDFTPAWAKQAHFGHHWLALVLPNDTTLAFDGTYRNPERGKNNPSRTAAKVYRFNFQADPDKVKIIAAKVKSLPKLEFIVSPYLTDVTSLYYETVDLRLPIPQHDPPSEHYCLGVFNYGQWKPVAYGTIENGGDSVLFSKMNRDILYILLRFESTDWLPTGDPFLLDSSGAIHYWSAGAPRKICLNTWFDWEEKQIEARDNLKLEYWGEDNWQVLEDEIRPVDSQICIDEVPANALLRLTNYRGRPYYMRPLIIQENNQAIFY